MAANSSGLSHSPDVGHLDHVGAPAEDGRRGEEEGVGPDEQDRQVGAPVGRLPRRQRPTDQAETLVGQHGQGGYRCDPWRASPIQCRPRGEGKNDLNWMRIPLEIYCNFSWEFADDGNHPPITPLLHLPNRDMKYP